MSDSAETYKERYEVEIDPMPDGRFIAVVPALRDCFAFGYSIEEARENLNDSLRQWFGSPIKRGRGPLRLTK